MAEGNPESMELSSPHSGIIAPFVMKTYQMVNDPSTDNLITWGSANNSILIVELINFSNRILPAYFKHNNFPSFVCQLNTYGFRKVDPNRWEFANQWFLRGQKHLLHSIGHRKHRGKAQCKCELGMDGEELLAEIARLRDEQTVLDEELRGMNRRLEATEQPPRQMMAFLCEVAVDLEMIPRMLPEEDLRKARNQTLSSEKKRRFVADSDPASSSSLLSTAVLKSIESEDNGVVFTPNVGFDIANLPPLPAHLESYPAVGYTNPPLSSGGQFICLAETGTEEPSPSQPPPYPFSLFGDGF